MNFCFSEQINIITIVFYFQTFGVLVLVAVSAVSALDEELGGALETLAEYASKLLEVSVSIIDLTY